LALLLRRVLLVLLLLRRLLLERNDADSLGSRLSHSSNAALLDSLIEHSS